MALINAKTILDSSILRRSIYRIGLLEEEVTLVSIIRPYTVSVEGLMTQIRTLLDMRCFSAKVHAENGCIHTALERHTNRSKNTKTKTLLTSAHSANPMRMVSEKSNLSRSCLFRFRQDAENEGEIPCVREQTFWQRLD